MLKSVTIKNFQKHEMLKIDLGQITSIVGPSDRGKSAILRAIRWVMTNRPNGEAFIKSGCETSKVQIVAETATINRVKGKKSNYYSINQKKLEAFGADVPEEVTKVFNISDLNFQGQHDAPFWLSDTAGTVSRNLNQIINLGAIDSTLANLNKKLKANKAKMDLVKDRLKEARDDRDGWGYVPTMDAKLKAVEQKQKLFQEAKDRAVLLDELVLEGAREDLAFKSSSVKTDSGMKAITAGDRWQVLLDKTEHLRNWIANLESQQHDSQIIVPDLSPLIEVQNAILELHALNESLTNLLDEYYYYQRQESEAVEKLDAAQKQMREALASEPCPICGKMQ